jgi:hypothetical protein
MLEQAPNGFFVRNLIVYGGLDKGGVVAKGYVFEAPDLQNADAGELNGFHDQINLLLASLHANQRLQFQWHCDSDYRKELLRYKKETEAAANPWSRRCRNERLLRYWTAMQERKLRREKLALFVSRKIEVGTGMKMGGKSLADYYDKLLSELESEFAQTGELINAIFTGQGTRLFPMKDEDHFRHYHRFLNPAVSERFDYDPIECFRPQASIQRNCWNSGARGGEDFGFFMDGHYHSVLAVNRWPRMTYPGIIRRLTAQRLLDYSITVNVTPLPIRDEIKKEEDAYKRIQGDHQAEGRLSFMTVLAKKERKVQALMEGHTLPFNALFVVRAWDRTKEGLAAKTAVLKNAINAMNGAQSFEPNLSTTTKKLFYMTWPGWSWGGYTAHYEYAENHYLADLLPMSSTFTGHLETAEAIYDGEESNIIGVKTFSGDKGNMSPQHAVLLGMSGTGKSATMCDLLTQTEPYYHYTVIVEEGLSYGIYTQTVDPEAKPIILQADGTLTINYFDTQGLPLSSLQLATCTALACQMMGRAKDEEKQTLRQAQVGKYILQLYQDAFEDWSRRYPLRLIAVSREALAVSHLRKTSMPPGATLLDAYAELRDLRRANADEVQAYIASFDDGEVTRFLKDPVTQKEVMRMAFAQFTKEQYPTHSMLQESMQLGAHSDGNKEQIMQMADMLLPWCQNGSYGALFDGVSNVSLTGKIAHFELGYIPDAAKDLKTAAGFLIANYTRQHIITLPRRLWKRNVHEEVARFLDIPGGQEIVAESYAQLRKFNVWNVSVVQQYSRFKDSRIRSVVFGNSKQYYLKKQNDREDLDDIGRDIALPEVTKKQIMAYPLPEQQVGQQKFSAFCYYHIDSLRPVCGTVRNIISKEMLFASSSSGEHFDERAKVLKGYEDPLEGIVTEANK